MKRLCIKIALSIFVIMLILTCFSSCGEVAVDSIVLSNTEMKINIGNTQAVSCTCLPENATDKTIIWESSNISVATVNNYGVISAVGAGTCTITAKSGNVSASLSVIVAKPVDQVVLNKTEVSIREEKTFSFVCSIIPNDASNKTISWESSNPSIATVDANGLVIGIKAGTCQITARVDEKSASAQITVKEKGPNFQALFDEYCNSIWAKVGNDGSYLSIDTNPYNYDDGDYRYIFVAHAAIENVNKKIGLPDSVYDSMNHTSALMGRQSQTFEKLGVVVSWTYHPDNGLEVTYSLIDD